MSELSSIMESPRDATVHRVNQVVRGHNYLYVDFIMNSKLATVEALAIVMKYFKLNIDFLVQYLSHVQEKF